METIGASDVSVASEAEFAALVTAMERSPGGDPKWTVAALNMVRHGIITGEGPTAAGRIHFSRVVDATDSAWLGRILLAAGAHAVTRSEADALFDIHEAALERLDHGAFDDLLAKAIAHHVLAASHASVPDRATALSSDTPVSAWATGRGLGSEAADWLDARMRRKRHNSLALSSLAALFGRPASSPTGTVVADLAA